MKAAIAALLVLLAYDVVLNRSANLHAAAAHVSQVAHEYATWNNG